MVKVSFNLYLGLLYLHALVVQAENTPTTPNPDTPPTVNGWNYAGCHVDSANRALVGQSYNSWSMTVESCVAFCSTGGYKYAGLEFSIECYCSNSIPTSTVTAPDTDCNFPCEGNYPEACGGWWRLALYTAPNVQIPSFTSSLPPATPTPTVKPILPLPSLVPALAQSILSAWKYQGCLDDSTTPSLPYQLILANNTVANCLTQCLTFGYSVAGLENGNQCYCGDPADVTSQTLMAQSDCSSACSGDASAICGGLQRLSYYTWTGAPLNSWSYATGTNAGAYEFLIGGLIVPLIATPAKNGKVTFMEKFGSGPPNSTGAYELDLSQIDNFAAAWRPMHVKSDVFCSAGLTLPDKAARQINIGGWTALSTFGVRLYTPDGSPGVRGVNDWQENAAEVALKVGRWYPSAMIMANGSILIVGGENGPNGGAVASLELLPPPPGGYAKYCDYLAQTDPMNLYPFIAVLPSRNILITYYNEARILDAITLDTKTILPTIPGAVNRPDAGRSYPFEGTGILLPQHWPYTDPLTVLICGGSTPVDGVAIDNCVSIQPEVNGAQWAIERMPSPRVMTTMAALPDGTYLILGGAQQGTAGFANSTDPNLSALLYDPSATLNSRFTVMASTTVARLYHSESVLLDDGRVLVSGSDPESDDFPQEYRIEVFMPPYLLSGAAQPTFSITNTDWAYGQNVTITLTSVTTITIRASLLGAVSSTHGNSMGQRTIFPGILCVGLICTITAPPNSGICPPGWFQLFILDGPTPSHATWVRIGGDPASIGNWPSGFNDFTVPGM